MPPEAKTAQINLRLPPALKQAAEQAAAQDHRSLTSLIEKLLADHLTSQVTIEDWHNRATASFLQLAVEKNLSGPLAHGVIARSYRVRTARGDRLKPHLLTQALHDVQVQTSRLISGPRIFYPYRNRPEIMPYFTVDRELARIGVGEILECALMQGAVSVPQFWRVSTDGFATEIGQHFEDHSDFAERGLEPGKWFSPFFMTRALAELVYHASAYVERFESADVVEFRCSWSGLREREISDADRLVAMTWARGKIAHADGVVTATECPVRDLRGKWDEIVSALGGPTMRLFDPVFEYSPQWVQEQVQRFNR